MPPPLSVIVPTCTDVESNMLIDKGSPFRSLSLAITRCLDARLMCAPSESGFAIGGTLTELNSASISAGERT